jgi:hypothetical protein
MEILHLQITKIYFRTFKRHHNQFSTLNILKQKMHWGKEPELSADWTNVPVVP